jgi:hypothetical protein
VCEDLALLFDLWGKGPGGGGDRDRSFRTVSAHLSEPTIESLKATLGSQHLSLAVRRTVDAGWIAIMDDTAREDLSLECRGHRCDMLARR